MTSTPLSDLLGDPDLVGEEAFADLVGHGPVELARLRVDIPRLRPVLVALAARAAGADRVGDEAQYAAEALGVALRMHDLALGREGGLRRRVARKFVRPAVTWLAAQQVSVRAMELARAARPEIMGDAVDVLRSFADAQATCENLRGRVPRRGDWLDHAESHSGALFAFSCRAGAHVAGASPSSVAALGRYGQHLGRLWHVLEDAALLRHEPARFAMRAVAGRPVLPVVIAAELDPTLGDAWTRLSASGDEVEAAELARRVLESGALATAAGLAAQESWAARRALATLPDTAARVRLDDVAAALARTLRDAE